MGPCLWFAIPFVEQRRFLQDWGSVGGYNWMGDTTGVDLAMEHQAMLDAGRILVKTARAE